MKPQKISDTSDLPPEFDAGKYNDLVRCSLLDWLHVIEVRFHLHRRLNDKSTTQSQMKAIRSDILSLLANPLPVFDSPFVENLSPQHRQEPIENTHSVRSLNMFSLMSIAHDRKHYGPAIDAYTKYFDGNPLSELERDLLRTSVFLLNSSDDLNRSPVVTTEIDLAMPDEMLIEDFKTWLTIIRSQIKTPPEKRGYGKQSKKIKLSVFESIRNACAVEYVDLFLWSKANNLEFTDALYCEAIYATTARSISETTEKWVNWLLSAKTIDTLKGQLASNTQ
ncbi:MAG: DUF6387 family protein [Azonexus sp.]